MYLVYHTYRNRRIACANTGLEGDLDVTQSRIPIRPYIVKTMNFHHQRDTYHTLAKSGRHGEL